MKEKTFKEDKRKIICRITGLLTKMSKEQLIRVYEVIKYIFIYG